MARTLAGVLLLCVTGAGWGATFRVRNTADSGSGSLRWAIRRASNHPGPDRIVFRTDLAGRVIQPLSQLPSLTDNATIIKGDINGDGAPDIAINGKRAGTASGLNIGAGECLVIGLAVTNFAADGIRLIGAHHCVIRSCHVGVNLAGTRAARNGGHQIYLFSSNDNTIGGPTLSGRNVVAAGSASPARAGIYLSNASGNHIRNNNIGLARDGITALTPPGDSGFGIYLYARPLVVLSTDRGNPAIPVPRTEDNLIGGSAGERNVIGNMRTGIRLSNADANVVRNNYIGLARNGRTVAGIRSQGIRVDRGSTGNIIGGTLGRHGNVFAGGSYGIYISDAGTEANLVRGNYFGLTARGTAQRRLVAGVAVSGDAGAQKIGGASAGNYFCPRYPGETTFGVLLFLGGDGTWISQNYFGVRPDGQPAVRYDYGVSATSAAASVYFNEFRRAVRAVDYAGTPAASTVLGNLFHDCSVAVRLRSNAQASLGNRSNATTGDDGWNEFHASNTWYIRNETPNFVRAEGNHFPAGFYFEVDAKIWDRQDEGTRGVVDYKPSQFDLPQAGSARVAVLGATATPAAGGGAEIAFSLSSAASASISVLNIAGRPVATVARDSALAAGVNRVVWSGTTERGTRAPAGRYLVRIEARGADGERARALAPLMLER